jgi:hypothetical protein
MTVTRTQLTAPLKSKLGVTLDTRATPVPTIYNIKADGEFATETKLPADATYHVVAIFGADGKELPLADVQTHLTTTRPVQLLLTTSVDEIAGAKGVAEYSASKVRGFFTSLGNIFF